MSGQKRYFIEVAYMGTGYAGFQVQKNANSIQAEVEKALSTFFRSPFELTGSSRTDAGVHAISNYFHFDAGNLPDGDGLDRAIYNLNAILPLNIVVKRIFEVAQDAHCRFDATARSYEYRLHQFKNPFLNQQSYFYPFKLDLDSMQQAARLILGSHDFEAFAKRNSQVFTYQCTIFESSWVKGDDSVCFRVTGNRFLRGMVRGLVGTMLKVGRGVKSVPDFQAIIDAKNPALVDFAVPPQGLTLTKVKYPFDEC